MDMKCRSVLSFLLLRGTSLLRHVLRYLLLVACGLAALAVGARADASPSFECAEEGGPLVEEMICHDDELANLDAQLAAKLGEVLSAARINREWVLRSGRSWLSSLARCTPIGAAPATDPKACLVRSYTEQLAKVERQIALARRTYRLPDVCAFVADAYTRGNQESISVSLAEPIDIRHDGKPLMVRPAAAGTSFVDLEVDGERYSVDPPDVEGIDSIRVIKYENRYYIVSVMHEAPVLVTAFGEGALCGFNADFTYIADPDHAADVCRKVMNGDTFERVVVDDVPGIVGVPSNFGPRWGAVGAGKLDLENSGKSASVALLRKEERGGACQATLLAIVDDGAPRRRTQRESLFGFEDEFAHECGADVFPIRVDGKLFIEADHAVNFYSQIAGGPISTAGLADLEPAMPARALLTLSDGGVDVVCRVRQTVTYKPSLPPMN